MKINGLRNVLIVLFSICIMFTSSSLAVAQPQKESHTTGLFHLQFVIIVSWSASDLDQPISPGETREVHLTISSSVAHGLFGKILLRHLSGETFLIQLMIAEKSEWCTVWFLEEYLTGFINPDEVFVQNTSLYIHLNNDAPTNYTLGIVKIQCKAYDMKGPLNLLTLISGYENTFPLTFVTSP